MLRQLIERRRLFDCEVSLGSVSFPVSLLDLEEVSVLAIGERVCMGVLLGQLSLGSGALLETDTTGRCCVSVVPFRSDVGSECDVRALPLSAWVRLHWLSRCSFQKRKDI